MIPLVVSELKKRLGIKEIPRGTVIDVGAHDRDDSYWAIMIGNLKTRNVKYFVRKGEEVLSHKKKKVKRFVEATKDEYWSIPYDSKKHTLVNWY